MCSNKKIISVKDLSRIHLEQVFLDVCDHSTFNLFKNVHCDPKTKHVNFKSID